MSPSAPHPSDIPYTCCEWCLEAPSELIVREQEIYGGLAETWDCFLCPACALAGLDEQPEALAEGRT